MKKLLFLSEAASLAHVGRPLTLAHWAFENDYEVHFACSKEGLRKTGSKDFPFSTYPLHSIEGTLFYSSVFTEAHLQVLAQRIEKAIGKDFEVKITFSPTF